MTPFPEAGRPAVLDHLDAAPAELLSQDQLQAHGAAIAASHTLAADPRQGRPLLPRLDACAEVLDQAYQYLSASARTDPQPVASENWLRDNYHVVQHQVREIQQHLPRKYYLELPKLSDGPFQGYPRVYLLARELTAHTAGRVDFETLVDFCSAYQRTATLSIGEVWAIPIMLRLALVEELGRLAGGVVGARRSREKAREWQEEVRGSDWTERHVRHLLKDGTQPDNRLSGAFVVELLQWLRDQSSAAAPAWNALQAALHDQGDSADEMLRLEHQREAADQLAIGNAITSMRLLSTIDWTLFFERVSVVERLLRDDPAGAYAAMDFPTRDRYRHSVEEVAKRTNRDEPEIATLALDLARAAMREDPGHDRRHHVGYYLISRGRFLLEKEVSYRTNVNERLARFAFRHQAIGYLGTLAALATAGVISLVLYAARRDATVAELWLVAAVVLLPVTELAISLVNLIVTGQVPPRELPKLAMRDGIPVSHRTLVVVPVILDSEARLSEFLHDLEVRFLGNRDPHLHFGLLSDFPDASQQTHDGEEAILESARRRVDALNDRHGAGRFFFLHRERRWNPAEGRWMGWERKRGKLTELNRLLRGATDTSFTVCHGDSTLLPSVRYVITLDSDTQLPMEAGRRLVGTLAHPLNRPRFDPTLGRVTEGYGLLQPRVGVSVVSANRTAFARAFSGHVGVDPYTTAVSDVYQDLFHEGSYVGKGIYDVDAFAAALAHRVPENTLLSHDLFEGFYARAGLCTDIQLVDDYPGQYLQFAARQHRWVRGDWQIVRWLWRTVPDDQRRPMPNTLPAIARWKILDNLRRSLLAPSLMLLLAAGWTVLPGSPVLWMILAVMVLAFPAYIQLGRTLSSRVRGVPLRHHIIAERENVHTSGRQSLLSTTFLAHQSYLMLGAVLRTLWRLLVSRRRLLEWVSAAQVARTDPSPRQVAQRMWAGPATAVAMAAVVGAVSPARLALALPILALWAGSPAIAYAIGRPLVHKRQTAGPRDRAALRGIARRTWRFFEDLLGPEDHWLIPDNVQDDRNERVAHRTSPTNIGLQLLSTVAAFDFGYLNVSGVVHRLEPMFTTLLGLPRFRGHFYNWYDTRTLAPLLPAYISTVDSGNLAGYLLTLKNGLLGIVNDVPLIDARALRGIDDNLDQLEEALAGVASSRKTAPARALTRELALLRGVLAEAPDTLSAWRTLLASIEERLDGLRPHLAQLGSAETEALFMADARHWLERTADAVAAWAGELDRLAPFASAGYSGGGAFTDGVPGLAALVHWYAQRAADSADSPDASAGADVMAAAQAYGQELIDRASRLADLADDFVEETEFGFLFDGTRQLFSIGYSAADGRLDASYYDTLASEARLASFVAIATGQVPHEHWFKLGRALTPAGSARALLSWSASMFEYMMPLLVMRGYPGTLLSETYRAVVERQQQYGEQRGVPWGISESAYNARDLQGNYQYRAFGVPGLGLKRGLADDLVVAPYACMLAAPIVPLDVLRNLEQLAARGLAGRYGFYEGIDYTADRNIEGTQGTVLKTYMAHHQGMSLVALDNALHDGPMQARFHADPRVQAADLLLQERIPQLVPLVRPPMEIVVSSQPQGLTESPSTRTYLTPHTVTPRTHLLSNGSYTVMVTNAGGGYSQRQQVAITRWREDATTDSWGSFCYVRDLDSGHVWSTAYQPTCQEPERYEVTFAPDRAGWRRLDAGIELATELVVSPEDDAELRRITITNHSGRARHLDLTSYAEVVLAPGDADLAHPAFSNLFVETRSVPERDALICMRRPRSGTERLYLVHVLSGRAAGGPAVEFETDRARFTGRGGTLARPAATARGGRLSKTTGPVLDPIVSLRHAVRLAAGTTARLTFTTAYAETETAALQLIEKYHDRRAVARALALASTHSQIEMRHLGFTVEDTLLFQRLGGRLLYADAGLRQPDDIARNRRSQRELWKYSISGDRPILLVTVAQGSEMPLVQELLKAHEYLRLKGLAFDLIVLNRHPASYLQELQQELQRLIDGSPEQPWIDRPGGIFLRRADVMPPEDQLLMRAAARVVMDAADGGLRNQMTRPLVPFTPALPAQASAPRVLSASLRPAAASPGSAADLERWNGVGGFAVEGREYVIPTGGGRALPPVPWANVVAHERFGFACTESGPGYTWSGNSHDNRLTPWRNDPVSDAPGESVFIEDEESGQRWSATPLPSGGDRPYVTRHGQGYSTYEHEREGLETTLTLFVPRDEPVKIFRLGVKNVTGQPRRCTVTLYVEWVLGENRTRTGMHVVTGIEPVSGAMTARNAFRQEFAERVAFLALSPGHGRSLTGDRTEFLGRNGSLDRSAGHAGALSDRTGAALDPCGAIRVRVELPPFSERTVVGLLGDADDEEQVRALVERYENVPAVDAALADVRGFWDGLLGTIAVRTPDRTMDLVLNRWLLYQTLACRVWGRSAFYQSSGAFGFRDQLQDTLALLASAPGLVRAHLLHAASRQFVEGDAQHWWHEPGGQGVRTRFSDDRLWLVHAALAYVGATGDDAVFDEQVPFLTARRLNPEEHEAYERPSISSETGSLYDHCCRAVAISMETGVHGLPLMGTGDWNDGMNMVGSGGRGESVWLGWFLISILRPFAEVVMLRGDTARAAAYRAHADALTEAVEGAWDGDWYRRAYFDDGTPLGSRENVECQIDAIAQSWAVVSGAGDAARARRAMESVEERLILKEAGVSLLLTPPFDLMTPSPGYIQGYLPGVRENGGQYTHAALWNVLAFARMGDGDRATALFAMLNPVNHARTEADVARYRAEPYVVAADVYSVPPHTGRGGWTWYTGSAGWMYRIGIEAILGVTLRRGALHIEPCIPRDWPGYEVTFTHRGSTYRIAVENPSRVCGGVNRLELDGRDHTGRDIELAGDGREHVVRVVLG